jgi:hypothetical protein
LRDLKDRETAAKVAAIFRRIAARRNSPLYKVITRAELDRLGAIPTATLMLEAAPGYSFDEELTGPETHAAGPDYRGTHGHLPTRAEMRSALVIYGAGARAGARVGLARMIDIAPTAATLLGLRLPQAEGRVRAELLKPGAARPTQPQTRPTAACFDLDQNRQAWAGGPEFTLPLIVPGMLSEQLGLSIDLVLARRLRP